jgi:hypothetical protein
MDSTAVVGAGAAAARQTDHKGLPGPDAVARRTALLRWDIIRKKILPHVAESKFPSRILEIAKLLQDARQRFQESKDFFQGYSDLCASSKRAIFQPRQAAHSEPLSSSLRNADG